MAAPLNELKVERQKAATAYVALLDAHEAAAKADKRGFTDAEKAAQATAKATLAGIDERLAAAQERMDLAKASNDGPTPAVSVEKPNLTADPRKGFRSHRDYLMAVMANSGHRDKAQVSDERLRYLSVTDKDDKAAAGEVAFLLPEAFTPPSFRATVGSDEQGVYSDPFGGFAVTTTRLPGMLQVGFEGDPTIGLTQSIPMQTPTVEILARVDKDHTTSVSGGFTVSRRAETAAMVASRGEMQVITLKAASLFGHAFSTEELLTDSPGSFVAIIDTGVRTQFGAHMLNEKLRGTGIGEFKGILTALAASSLGPTISIAKEAAQVADTIVSQNVIKMAARVWGMDNAVWLANHDTKPQLYILSIAVGASGTLIFQPSREKGFPDMLLGRPVYYTEYASKLGDQGDLMLVNMSQYLEGIYQPLQSAESMHVRFLNHERAFKFWLRNAGAPWWDAALTPAKSSATLSPFVVLDAR